MITVGEFWEFGDKFKLASRKPDNQVELDVLRFEAKRLGITVEVSTHPLGTEYILRADTPDGEASSLFVVG